MNPFVPSEVKELLSKPVTFYKQYTAETSSGKPPITNIAFVLDCSGSMQHGKTETVEGFNQQVVAIRRGSEGAGETTFTDVHFSSEVNIRAVATDLDNLMPLTDETYQPGGNTALLDAIGSTIASLLSTKDISSPDTATLVTTFTDGQENASRIYSAAMIRDMVRRLEATGRWTFALVGPQQTVSGLADLLAVRAENIAGFDVSSVADKRRAFQRVAAASEAVMYQRRQEGKKQFDSLYGPVDQ